MAVVGSFRSGKASRIQVGTGTFLTENHWDVTETGDMQDTTNFECFTTDFGSSGITGGRTMTQGLIGNESADVSAGGNWDANQNPYEDPPGIFISDQGPTTLLYINRVDNTFFGFDETLITQAAIGVDQDGVVTFAWKFKNQGPWSRPEGNFV